MPSVQIKNVPDDVHAVLHRRADAAHQSLQEYLLDLLVTQARQATVEEVFARVPRNSGGSVPLRAAVRAVRRDRARH